MQHLGFGHPVGMSAHHAESSVTGHLDEFGTSQNRKVAMDHLNTCFLLRSY